MLYFSGGIIEEYHQLLMKFNGTEADFSWHHCIHELFEAQVEQTPEAIAIIYPTNKFIVLLVKNN